VTTTAPTKAINPKLVLHVIAPLVAFYGLRALGVPAFTALLAGAGVSAAAALHSIATVCRSSCWPPWLSRCCSPSSPATRA
jgi:hypothetical protein